MNQKYLGMMISDRNILKFLKNGFIMKINKINASLLCLTLMMSTPGYARYKATPLNKKTSVKVDALAKEAMSVQTVSFDCKVFSAKDCKKYLNSKSIIKKGFQPIEVTFTNNSKHSIEISPEDFNFTCVNAQYVASALHRDGAARGLGLGIGGFLFMPILIVPAIVQGCGANDYNYDMDNDFSNKEFVKQTVAPGATVSGIVFAVRREFKRDFTFTVKNKAVKEPLIFSTKNSVITL